MFTSEDKLDPNVLAVIAKKEIAITGTLPILREEMVAWIEAHGGQYHDGVRRSTDTLIVGELPGFITRKLARALELNAKGNRVVILDGAILLAKIRQYRNAVGDTSV